jgi:spermidine synthase
MHPTSPSKLNTKLVYLTVFATGLFSLVYQIVWQRYLTYLVGADSLSSVITLTVFLTALSFGYWLAGKFSNKIKSKEIFYYGLVEFIIGFWAIIFPWLFEVSLSLVTTGYFHGLFGDVLLAVLLTAIPATLMGTTLPFLTQGLSQSFEASSRTHAFVYAVNTIGACIGTLLAGFVLVQQIGLAATIYIVGGLNIGFGVFMIYQSRYSSQVSRSDPNQDVVQAASKNFKVNKFPLLAVAACSGYLLIAIESYFIRLYSIATDGSNHAYPAVVTAFIAAVGIGAALSGKLMHKAEKVYWKIPLISLVSWMVIYFSLPYWPYADYLIKHYVVQLFNNYEYLSFVRFLLVFLVIGIPIIASSMLLPFSFHFFKNHSNSIGKTTGDLYAVATIATVIGGLIGGYLVFQVLDFRQVFQSHLLIMALMALFAVLTIQYSVKFRIISALSVVLISTLMVTTIKNNDLDKKLALSFYFQTPSANDTPIKTSKQATQWLWDWFDYDEIISTSMQPEGLVSVFDKNNGQDRMVTINGRSNSGTTGTDYQGNALLSLFPYMMTQNPQKVLVIGLGTGVTVGAIANQQLVEKVDVCEINKAVSEQLKYFDFASFNASNNDKVNIIDSDVVKYLLRTDVEYDIIVSIPSNFWVAGVENLMTPEFYSLAESKLTQGGTFIQWIPDYEFSEKALKIMLKSFNTSFENPSLWRLTQDDLVLMYQKGNIDKRSWLPTRLVEPPLLETMDAIEYYNPRRLTYAQIADSNLVENIGSNGLTHTLNQPSLGITVLKSLYSPEQGYSAERIINQIQFKKPN